MADSHKEKPTRDRRLNIPLSDEEKTEIRIRAAREDKAMTEYVRGILFGDDEPVPA